MHKIVWKEFYFREFLMLLGLITNRQFLWQLFFHFSLYRGCLLPLLLVYHSIVLCSSIGAQGYCNLKFFFVFRKKTFLYNFFLSLLIYYVPMMEKKRTFFHLYFCYSTKALTVKKWDGHDGNFIFDVYSDSCLFTWYTQTLI